MYSDAHQCCRVFEGITKCSTVSKMVATAKPLLYEKILNSATLLLNSSWDVGVWIADGESTIPPDGFLEY